MISSETTPESNIVLAVIVDDHTYPLAQSTVSPLIYTGTAPAASSDDGYYYAKTKDGAIVEHEYKARSTIYDGATPYQFYNRSQDHWNVTPLPAVVDPLLPIHRIDSNLHIFGEIPTIQITGNQTDIDYMHTNIFEDYQLMTDVVYIRENEIQRFNGVEFELAGKAARVNPKVSYNIKIPKGGDTLYGYRRIKLRSLSSDPSYIREALAYAAIESTGLASNHFSYAIVFVNNQTAGFLGYIENYKDPWFRNEFGNGNKDEYSQGKAYQGIGSGDSEGLAPNNHTSDLSYYGDNVTAYADGQYKIKEDPSEGDPDYRPLMELTKFLSEAPIESDDAVSQWEEHFGMDSVLRSMALEVLLGYSDGYIAMQISISHLEVRLSNYPICLSGDYRDFPAIGIRPLTSQFLRVPEFKEPFEILLKNLARTLVSLDVMEPFIDDTVAMVREDVEWDHTLAPLSLFNFSSLADGQLTDDINIGINDWPWPVDNETVYDMFYVRHMLDITFGKAVTGPIGTISLCGVKEFVAKQSRATTKFFETHVD
ncbi:coth protein-domain-containing protein [Zychaea mexicana]|uniref:coth protein-domain-containing protein n=1 Tax=Zychaea mexicana TaxID=64656 RepID=UPI0022FF3F4E|nr:coth protein-domain-containing protein [Zychaea mexicana]KAI9499496.1 coth protein-domain-containing protein [Zychaea mexicana]